MENREFIPVVLGIDVGAYSIARTFYEHYQVKTIIVGKYTYWMTCYSKITETYIVNNMKEEILIKFLIELAGKYKNKKLLLFGCSEDYVDIIIRNKKELSKYFVVPMVDEDVLNKAEAIEKFLKELQRKYEFITKEK